MLLNRLPRMPRLDRLHLLTLVALAFCAACSSAANKPTTPSATAARSSAVATVAGPATTAAGSATSVVPAATPSGPVGPSTGSGTPSAADAVCAEFTNDPLKGGAQNDAARITGGSPQPNAPQPARPAVDLNAFTLPDSALPAGWHRFGDDKMTISGIVNGTANLQANVDFLNQIGFSAGRQENWSTDVIQKRYPTIYFQIFVFNTDAGASKWLRSPVFGDKICLHSEQGPVLGQESIGFYFEYSAPLVDNSLGTSDGHSDFVRCGRVVGAITAAGAPGEFTKAYVDGLTKIATDLLAKTQPCAPGK